MSKKMFGDILKQAQKMQEQLAKIQEEAGNKTVEASSGGGMVTVTANGRQEILSIKIERDVVNPDDVEMLQDLVVAATNEALSKAKDMMAEEMKGLTGGMGLNIPGLSGMI
ncbi:MAG: nucleoid-associated protein, YbaB/EbfC family [Nitrospirae bacterium RIFCSPLOW2_12_42_9]|nr:MAG: nucleoid-associated protein, YbaB/EbfC family [Nitrospirae bacterium RIFCSPLOWO2_02_42_7]OGW59135.1 MAG: nucleoid-associated protein, YbaB/EbfC family [Nitrospirae bacterium RIFCSPHIGHO2_02_FULL_42_12]OGW62823.1 MAG: nucleoid-associated protein, YbaB/EbfC family [Nitrospirae bacterium RIFCSPLOW2_12_42_9]HAS16640.1 YbaB/EbfC family nucleoid-associated protein [Nitrospiraceae bacterium]HBI22982.1 YbaB/EbfC family nucleoid-associated protein [Nitrospiraceae bacterium]